jgi:hypothetical protein
LKSLWIIWANKNKCLLGKEAEPIKIKIKRKYNRAEFLNEIRDNYKNLELPNV